MAAGVAVRDNRLETYRDELFDAADSRDLVRVNNLINSELFNRVDIVALEEAYGTAHESGYVDIIEALEQSPRGLEITEQFFRVIREVYGEA